MFLFLFLSLKMHQIYFVWFLTGFKFKKVPELNFLELARYSVTNTIAFKYKSVTLQKYIMAITTCVKR